MGDIVPARAGGGTWLRPQRFGGGLRNLMRPVQVGGRNFVGWIRSITIEGLKGSLAKQQEEPQTVLEGETSYWIVPTGDNHS
jgi:hypothetical protein